MNIGILWDIENVTPPTGIKSVQSIIDAVSIDGRLSYAMAFGDWNNSQITKIAEELSSNNFELIHTPHNGKKNSTDMSLIAHGVELIFQYPYIERYVLISGDGDFRSLLQTQKKHGKETWVVCDRNNSASNDLIKMADHSLDFRDILKSVDGPPENPTEEEELSKESAFELFLQTVQLMTKEGHKPASSAVKSRMKQLNESFDEHKLGYNSWLVFVHDAKKVNRITFENGVFKLPPKTINETPTPVIYKKLLSILPPDGDWEEFSTVASKIRFKQSKSKFKGYKKFMDFVKEAEKRGYIIMRNKGVIWSIKRNPDYEEVEG
jgi:uncharacterized LabA/DUF88 family protein